MDLTDEQWKILELPDHCPPYQISHRRFQEWNDAKNNSQFG
ncbi:hypothetical protein LEP1GSC187_1481 [Leptospira santarosai str. ZUN179]|uniref:Uncharacterized protein n=2 Tax=Leptospira santarosai TaxID=28183 RepID=M6UMA0_9LEPT|nr:hypothetical protein LEP1GSC063_3040 [Leptospira santarosai serovar Arenal str. MAVJ 401]EMO45705.1 hypothetical protein LEP1GSC187_1481 [Leptospira santarosai str. ZUN179]